MNMNFEQFTKKLLKNPEFKKEYERENIADNIIDARLKAGLTQEELAQRMGTKQGSIARWENETTRPSLTSLDKIAKALRTELIDPTFKSILKKLKKQKVKIIYKEKKVFYTEYYCVGENQTNTKNHTIINKEIVSDGVSNLKSYKLSK